MLGRLGWADGVVDAVVCDDDVCFVWTAEGPKDAEIVDYH